MVYSMRKILCRCRGFFFGIRLIGLGRLNRLIRLIGLIGLIELIELIELIGLIRLIGFTEIIKGTDATADLQQADRLKFFLTFY